MMATADSTDWSGRGNGSREPRSEESRRVYLMGVGVDDVDEDEVIDRMMSSLRQGRGGWVFTPNVDIVRQVVADDGLQRLVGDADLAIPDGMPLVWASRLQRTPLRTRVAASHLVYPLCRRAAALGYSVYLLGGSEAASARAAAALEAAAPGLSIAGCSSPPHGFESSPTETARVLESLKQAAPDIVICAFGFPKQERLMTVLCRLFPSAWFIGAGGTLTIAAGITPAAPRWMRQSGLEWLHRLRLEPRRLFRRYIIDDIPFALRLLAAAAARPGRHTRAEPGAAAPEGATLPHGAAAPEVGGPPRGFRG